jgi:hypothetical protein
VQRAASRGVVRCWSGVHEHRRRVNRSILRVPTLVGPGSAERHFAPHRVRDTAYRGIRPVYPDFRGEEFSPWPPSASKKTTAIWLRNKADIAIFAALSTPLRGGTTFLTAPMTSAELPRAPRELRPCSKPSFYSGAHRRGLADGLPSSSRSRPPPCEMLAYNQAASVSAAASGVNLSEKHAPLGLRFSTVMTAECSSAIR